MKNRIFGYCRISTQKQSIERQIDNIKSKYPDAVIIEEASTGTTMDRPAWNKLYKQLHEGDTVIFDEVSRMSRNAEEGFEVYQELFNRGVALVFLKEGMLNTEVFKQTQQIALIGDEIADIYIDATNRVLMILAEKQIKVAFETAQHEVDFLHKRTSEGVRRAQERYERETALGLPHEKDKPGQKQGAKLTTKKSIEAKKKIEKYSRDFNGFLPDAEVIKLTGLSRNTYYKYKSEMKQLHGFEIEIAGEIHDIEVPKY